MKKSIVITSVIVSAGYAHAATTFTEGSDKLWSNAANWSDGVPSGGEATTIATGEAVVAADVTAGFGELTVNEGASVTVNSGITLRANQAQDSFINGTMTVNGTYTVYGTGADLTIGSSGVVNITSTGTLDARKNTTIANGGGLLNLSSTAGTWNPQEKVAIGNGSTLHFDVFGGLSSSIMGDADGVNIGLHNTNSTLSLDVMNTGVGTYDLISNINNIQWFSGSTVVNDREFKESVTNLGAGLEYDIVYDLSSATIADRKISLVITAVPEPSSAALLGLGGLSLLLRRNK